jgi:non-homologous end joining protein Ku
MPARPTWRGYLKISLVNIPIKVFPATDTGATLSFNQSLGVSDANPAEALVSALCV